ncbi:MAG TPA: hypothetical protein VLM85_26395 [Polyangiaceae bacterium]|nr:hypothetical protein [Polyangiaceae bacterium]
MTSKSLVSISVLLFAAALSDMTGCSSDYKAPTASVTGPATVAVGDKVQLDGSGSADPNTPALPLTYEWSLASVPAGSSAKIEQAQDSKPWFSPDVAGDYVVQLVVSDGMLASTAAQAKLTAGPCGANPLVVSNLAATPAAPNTGDVVVLSATISDADNSPACKLDDPTIPHWALDGVPAGSAAVLSGPNQSSPWFKADVPGDYIVSLYATDTLDKSASPVQTLKVTAAACGSHAPVAKMDPTLVTFPPGFPYPNFWWWNNNFNNNGLRDLCLYGGSQNNNVWSINCGWTSPSKTYGQTQFNFTGPAPTATANTTPPPDYDVYTSGWAAVQLDGSASFDPDNQGSCGMSQTLSYAWTIASSPAGASARWVDSSGCFLGNGNNNCPANLSSTLVSPTLNVDTAGVYRVQLVVSDGQLSSAPITIDVNTKQ